MSEVSGSQWPKSSAIRLSDRDKEFKVAFERATRALTGGDAQIINLVGDRGMGKSRLVEEILDRLTAPPFPEVRVLRVGAWAGNHGEPLERLLVDAFRQDDDADDANARLRLRAELTLCARDIGLDSLPFLLARVLYQGGSDTPLLQSLSEDEAPQRSMAAELLATLWARLSEEKPLVLVIEDLQFCPQATIEFVRHLSRSLYGSVLLLVTSRVDEFKGVSVDSEHICRLTLAPLSPTRCLELVRKELKLRASDPPQALIDACQRLSAGSSVEQSLRLLEFRGAFRRTNDPERPLECDDNRVGYVANLLMAERAQVEGTAHEAAQAYMTAGRFALAAREPSWCVTLADAAIQLLGDGPCRESALAQLNRGQALRQLGKMDEAMGAFQQMALLAAGIAEPGLLATAHAEVGHSHRERGDLLLARQYLDFALASFESLNKLLEAASVHEELARLDLLEGDYSSAHDHVVTALHWAAELGDRSALARSLTVQASILLEDGERSLALAAVERALEICAAQRDVHGATENLFLLGRIAEREGELSRALELFFDSLDLARELDYFSALPSLWIEIANCQQHLGHVDEARGALAKAEDLLARWPNKLSLAELRRVEAKLQLRSENTYAARVAARSSVLLYRQAQCRTGLVGALRTLGEALGAESERDDRRVSRCFVEAVGIGKAIHNQQEIAKTYYAFAKFALQAPEYAEHEAIRAEAFKLRVVAGELFASQRVVLEEDAWFELRMRGLSVHSTEAPRGH